MGLFNNGPSVHDIDGEYVYVYTGAYAPPNGSAQDEPDADAKEKP